MDQESLEARLESQENEIRDLREKNSELVQEVQHLKLAAAQRDKERLDLMRDNNELRLKLSRLRSASAALDTKMHAEMKALDEKIINHLVQTSGFVVTNMELRNQYLQKRQELERGLPAGSGASTPSPVEQQRVRRVPPLLIDGQWLQPVVALSRTMLETSPTTRPPNQQRMAAPMHSLQDLYIPLTRIDLAHINNSMADDTDDLRLEDQNQPETDSWEEGDNGSDHRSSVGAGVDNHTDNPMEGPSWLLDEPGGREQPQPQPQPALEADSTTGHPPSPVLGRGARAQSRGRSPPPSWTPKAYSPTVRRRRKRPSTPPRLSPERHSIEESKVLKVVLSRDDIPKWRGGVTPTGAGGAPAPTPLRRLSVDVTRLTLSAPSPGPRGSLTHSMGPMRVSRRMTDSSDTPTGRRMSLQDGFPNCTETGPKSPAETLCFGFQSTAAGDLSPVAGGSGEHPRRRRSSAKTCDICNGQELGDLQDSDDSNGWSSKKLPDGAELDFGSEYFPTEKTDSTQSHRSHGTLEDISCQSSNRSHEVQVIDDSDSDSTRGSGITREASHAEAGGSGEPRARLKQRRCSAAPTRVDCDRGTANEVTESRTRRRARKSGMYREIPLNRKMRR